MHVAQNLYTVVYSLSCCAKSVYSISCCGKSIYFLACCANSVYSSACCAKSIYSLACCAKSIHMYSHAFVNLVTLHPVTRWYVVRVHLAELG